MKINLTTHLLKAEGNEKIITSKISPNQKALTTTNNLPKDLIIHYTACNLQVTLNTFLKKNSTSAHLVIDRDATIYQMVPFNRQAFHAGYSTWDNVTAFNNRSIGIELINMGWDTDGLKATDIVTAKHKHKFINFSTWQKYTVAQMDALYQVSKLLLSTYNLSRILGHDDISAGRKQDPGPAFNWNEYRIAVLGNTNNIGKIFKTNGKVNLRKCDSANTELLKELPANFEVGLIETWNNWSKVYLANSASDVTLKIKNAKGETVLSNIKTIGWVRSDLISLK